AWSGIASLDRIWAAMRLLLFGHTAALTLRWLPELIDVEHRVDHGILQLAADRLHAADVRRDHGVLLVVEPERAARRLQASLEAVLVPGLHPLRRARAPENSDHRVELGRLAVDPGDVGSDVDGAERHQHLLDGLASTLHERLHEAVGLLVTGDVIEGDHGDPPVAELGRHVPAAGRLLLVAAHRA